MSLIARQLHGERLPGEQVRAVTLEISPGQIVLFFGAEKAGHHLLVRLLSLLEVPATGDVFLDERSTSRLSPAERLDLRSRNFGYVFADPLLLPGFSLIENIAMPLFKICQLATGEARARAEYWLDFVGLRDVAFQPVDTLPVEARSRAALARALAHEPQFLVVEKLDAHRDQHTQLHFLSLLQRVVESRALTVLISANTRALAAFTDRVIEMKAGCVRYDSHPVAS